MKRIILAPFLFCSGLVAALAVAGMPASTEAATPACTDYPAWKGGTRYVSGNVVSNRAGIYRCKAGAAGGWCQFAAYEPGTTLGAQAWDRLGDCTAIPTYDCPGNPPPAWVANGPYVSGSLVLGRDGYLYECRSWPNSQFCPQAAYEPGFGLGWEQAWTRGNQCVVFEYADLVVDRIATPTTTCPSGEAPSAVLSATISDQSPFAPVHDVLVTFYDGHPSFRRVIDTVEVINVQPGGVPTTVNVTWQPARLGALELYVVVDDDGTGAGREVESNENNNVARLPTQIACP